MRLFYLVVFLAVLGGIPTVFAEKGPNYDHIQLDEKTFQWSSHYPRIWDGDSWENYLYSNNQDYIRFESAGISYQFDRASCSFKLYEGGRVAEQSPVITSVSHTLKEAIGGTDNWNAQHGGTCNVSFSNTSHDIRLIATRTINQIELKTIYEVRGYGFMEWTHEITNNNPAKNNHKYGVTDVFNTDQSVEISGVSYANSTFTKQQLEDQKITIGNYIYDHKNYQHDYLWAIKKQPDKIIADFTDSKGALGLGQKIVIDPTFTANADQYGPQANLPGAAGASCNAANYATNAGGVAVRKRASATAAECSGQAFQWNISTIPDSALISNSSLKITVSGVTNPINCDVTQITVDASTATGQQLWEDMVGITSDVDYLSNNAYCTTNGYRDLDLGATFDSYLQNTGLTQNRVAVGLWYFDQTRDASAHAFDLSTTNTLTVTYSVPQVSLALKPMRYDNSTVIGTGWVYRTNSTNTQINTINSTGWAAFTDVVYVAKYNYTVKDALDNFVTNKTINKNMTASQSKQSRTNIFDVNCGGDGDTDWQIKTNFTNYHNSSYWQTPTCNSDGDINWLVRFLKAGLGPSTNQTTKVIARSLDTAEYNWCPSKVLANGTEATYNCNTGSIVFNGTNIQVANGYNNVRIAFKLITDNVTSVPTSLSANPISETKITLTWNAPSETHGSAIQSYRIWRDNAIYVNSTGSTSATYTDNSAGPAGTSHTYMVCAWNGIGCSRYSNSATNSTWTTTTGTITLQSGNVGDAININATITLTAGSPTPVTVQTVNLIRNNTIVQTNTTDMTISTVGGTATSKIWYQLTNAGLNVFRVNAILTNSTGTVTLVSSNSNITREYDPEYYTAIDPAEGLVNATITRTADQDVVVIKINRDRGGATFNVECLLQTQSQASFSPTEGTWVNKSGVGYYNTTYSGLGGDPLYGTCYNSGELLTFQNYGNGSLILFGIQIFDDTYGAFLGVPVGVFFIVMLAGAASQRTAPTWIVILLAVAGVMATIGFFELETNIWALSLVAGLLGLIVGRKFF